MSRVRIFKDMNEAYLNLLERLYERYSFRAGTVVVQQGAPADYLYIVISGKAQVSFKPYDGSTITIAL
jgi:CRP-like cAMP-binding protein